MLSARHYLIWGGVLGLVSITFWLALSSPLLQWREPVYIIAAFAGVFGMGLMLLQPLLVGGYLPAFEAGRGRKGHRIVGVLLVLSVVVHVVGLWLTSPPDVVDALLFVSPTPFSAWGVIAMWALFGAALLASFRQSMRARFRLWRASHTGLVVVVVFGTVLHAVQIQGTMETISKWTLSILVILALGRVIFNRRVWALFPLSNQR
ncbi:ferric reductase-like transmembrane domain-containing protein [Marivita sp. XM-24bin2]|jgi:predicted ferric reductase|uniref:ferric reductase-like transmembrane domain-containing protein n=1 Tax=unclassified Marivita TaxID=2632480 RepID=UPI000D7A11CD|nr:ferric reductase-like transmembrane domain-containing protein [Marivita sp. XM-24bin2]MCR9109755.1 ferric reductase-like transmembrane domain-containing protein [Paracoccaceae bacterium]PWL36237.1 MAG: ferric reductase [Marivita sp. XM-24bin2]